MGWTQAMCEACWIDQRGEWEPVPGGQMLVGVPVPVRVNVDMLDKPTMETCSWCGRPTFVGIFVRADPSDVPFPRKDTDE